MMRKPIMKNASVVKNRDRYRKLIEAGVSEKMARFVAMRERKELNSQDFGINSCFKIVGDCNLTDYESVWTEGVSDSLSLFRITGGCNHLEAFEAPSAEKCEDYDSLSPSDICVFSSDYGTAKADLLANYIGKTLRVVARTGEGTAPCGTRYYLFTVDK